MGYFKIREVEVRKRGYTILEDVADPLDKTFVRHVAVYLDELDSLRKEL